MPAIIGTQVLLILTSYPFIARISKVSKCGFSLIENAFLDYSPLFPILVNSVSCSLGFSVSGGLYVCLILPGGYHFGGFNGFFFGDCGRLGGFGGRLSTLGVGQPNSVPCQPTGGGDIGVAHCNLAPAFIFEIKLFLSACVFAFAAIGRFEISLTSVSYLHTCSAVSSK